MIGVLGSVNLDLICPVDQLPKPGETVGGGELLRMPGGKGANQALAARRAGAEVKMFAAVGTDSFADDALAYLRQDGVGLDTVRMVDGATGTALIFVDSHAENVIALSPGANKTLTPDDAEAAVAALPDGATLMLQNEIPLATTKAAIEAARRRGLRTIYNVAPFVPEARTLASLVSVLVTNFEEFRQLTGEAPSPDALKRWVAQTGQPIVVTLGADGVLIAEDDTVDRIEAVKIEPVDTTGAGDTFCGYLAAALDSGSTLGDAVRLAARAAARACLNRGAQPAIPFANEID